MATNSKIEWTDHTFNPWIGCTKVSPGCANCYAEALMDRRHGRAKWGPGQPRVRTGAGNWLLPRRWNRQFIRNFGVELCQPRPKVFCASLADWLDADVEIGWLADLLKLVSETQNLDWLLLTKRPENFMARVGEAAIELDCRGDGDAAGFCYEWLGGERHPKHVMVGASIEDQARAEIRLPELIKIPALCRFVSAEPLLGPLHFRPEHIRKIDWVIIGGESGPRARVCNVQWVEHLVEQCAEWNTACFVKQLGAKVVGAKCSHSKGADTGEWPPHLAVRQFPD